MRDQDPDMYYPGSGKSGVLGEVELHEKNPLRGLARTSISPHIQLPMCNEYHGVAGKSRTLEIGGGGAVLYPDSAHWYNVR